MLTLGKQNLLLLLIALVMIGLITWLPEEAKTPQFQDTLPIESVQRLTLNRHELETVQLHRGAKGPWQMSKPWAVPANPDRVKQILKLLKTPSDKGFTVPATELAQYGLAKPRVTLQLNQERFDFGDQETVSQKRYMRYRGQIHLVDDTLYYLMRMDSRQYASLRLAPQPLSRIDTPSGSLWLTSEDQLKHNLSGITAKRVNALWQAWQDIEADKVEKLTQQAINDKHPSGSATRFTLSAGSAQIHYHSYQVGDILYLEDRQRMLRFSLSLGKWQKLYPVHNRNVNNLHEHSPATTINREKNSTDPAAKSP